MSITLGNKTDYRCVACERKQLSPGEGRVIDGSWADDAKVKKYRGKWVCGYGCYRELIERGIAGGHTHGDRMNPYNELTTMAARLEELRGLVENEDAREAIDMAGDFVSQAIDALIGDVCEALAD